MYTGEGLFVDITHSIDRFQLEVRFKASNGITALFGPSGSGKTTLVNILAGLKSANAGFISINDVILFDKKKGTNLATQKRRIGYVFQENFLFPHMDVKGNLLYGKYFIPKREDRVDFSHILNLLDLKELLNRFPRSLSGGERQRVAIGRALLVAPHLVLMDEPLASLDPVRKAEIIPYIEKLRNDFNIPIVYVSHNVDEIIRLADTIVVLDKGQSIISGPIEDVMSRLDNPAIIPQKDTGVVLSGTVNSHDSEFQISELMIKGFPFYVPILKSKVGSNIRIRILGKNVSLSLLQPENTSILNIFRARVIKFSKSSGPYVDVLLDIGANLIAKVTKKSVYQMNLTAGADVFALIKAASIDQNSTNTLIDISEEDRVI